MLGEYELNKVMCLDSYKAIKSIPDKSIDCIYTDIPYLIEAVGGWHFKNSTASNQNEARVTEQQYL